MEKFGLLPKDYPLEQTLMKVLTEQIAGLYDPEGKEFFIANWNSDADVRMVMSPRTYACVARPAFSHRQVDGRGKTQ